VRHDFNDLSKCRDGRTENVRKTSSDVVGHLWRSNFPTNPMDD